MITKPHYKYVGNGKWQKIDNHATVDPNLRKHGIVYIKGKDHPKQSDIKFT